MQNCKKKREGVVLPALSLPTHPSGCGGEPTRHSPPTWGVIAPALKRGQAWIVGSVCQHVNTQRRGGSNRRATGRRIRYSEAGRGQRCHRERGGVRLGRGGGSVLKVGLHQPQLGQDGDHRGAAAGVGLPAALHEAAHALQAGACARLPPPSPTLCETVT